jgi:hypothetical protein
MKLKIILAVSLWLAFGITGAEYLCKNLINNKDDITYAFYWFCSLAGPIAWVPIMIDESDGFGKIERFNQ